MVANAGQDLGATTTTADINININYILRAY
jgi:hypothetical protein